jgi:hypothetical protein
MSEVTRNSRNSSREGVDGLKSVGKDKEKYDAEKLKQKIEDTARKDESALWGG